jgi:predicted outer membrane protein
MKEFLFSLLRVPTADVMAVRELEEAKRELLRSQSAQDYAKRMVEYHQDRVKRLSAYVEKSNGV